MNAEIPQREPLVSILLPYYKLGNFLLEAVDSVRAQTHQNWELIVVDDCSPVCPAKEVLTKYDDPRIRIFRHEENRGNAAARNTAAQNSSGELLLPLDSNDLLAPDYIEATLKVMNDAQASAAYTDVKIFGMHDYVYKPSHDLGEIISGHYPHNTLILKREVYDAVGGYKDIKAIVDTEFWISIIEIGTKFAYLPEPLYLYRWHSESWSQNIGSLQMEFLKVLLLHLDTTKKHLPKMLEGMMNSASAPVFIQNRKSSRQQSYDRLHKEFHELLTRYEQLEKQAERTEQILASFPKLMRQFAYVALKKVGLRN